MTVVRNEKLCNLIAGFTVEPAALTRDARSTMFVAIRS
jgi:hypothetical protein